MTALEITGLDALDNALRVFPDRVARRLLGNASRAGARVIRDAAKGNVPVRTGRLRSAIRVQGKRLRGGSYRARVGIADSGKSTPYYGRFLEEGAAPHRIRARRRSWRRGWRRGVRGFLSFGGTVRRSVWHPGVAARHWMRRAAAQSAQSAIDKFAQNLLRGLERETAKLGGSR